LNTASVTATSSVATIFVNVGPPLNFHVAADQFSLRWPASASTFQLYWTTDLTPPVAWSLWTNTVQNSGGVMEANVPVNGLNQFFQLRIP
jgi:hypothetical protein